MSAVTRKDIAAAYNRGDLKATDMSYPLSWYTWQDGIVTVVLHRDQLPPKFADDPVAERAWWDRWTKG